MQQFLNIVQARLFIGDLYQARLFKHQRVSWTYIYKATGQLMVKFMATNDHHVMLDYQQLRAEVIFYYYGRNLRSSCPQTIEPYAPFVKERSNIYYLTFTDIFQLVFLLISWVCERLSTVNAIKQLFSRVSSIMTFQCSWLCE